MASSFSVWLHETARLYLRYAAVGLIGVPLALLYALARRADWNTTVVAGALIVLGFVGALWLWRRLGDWRLRSADPSAVRTTDATSDSWVDLVNKALHTANQQQVILTQQWVDADTWYRTLASQVSTLSSLDVEVADAVIKSVLQQELIAFEQELHRHSLVHRVASQPNARTGQIGQRQPAWEWALNVQRQSAHGLA